MNLLNKGNYKLQSRLLSITLFSFIIFGCTTEAVKIAEEQATMKSCCESFSNMHYNPISVNTFSRMKIDKNSQFFSFEEGKSFFKAYKLDNKTKTITVRSYYKPQNFVTGMFRPVITLLDKSYKKTRMLSPFVHQSKDKVKDPFGYFLISRKPVEKYFIIHTDDESYGDTFYHLHPINQVTKKDDCIDPRVASVLGGAVGAMFSANCGDKGKEIPHTVIGEISIEVK